MMSESEQLRVLYEGIVKQNSSNVEAVHYLAVWHLERQSYLQVTSLLFRYVLVLYTHMILRIHAYLWH